MSLVTVSGNVVELIGRHKLGRRVPSSGTVRFMLVVPPQASAVATDARTGRPAPVHYDFPVRWNGEFSGEVLRNDKIVPAGTMYSVHVMVPNVNLVPKFFRFDAPGPYDMNTLVPVIDPERVDHEKAEAEKADAEARTTAARTKAHRAAEIRSQIVALQTELDTLV